MWELKAFLPHIETGDSILKKAGLAVEANHAFDAIKKAGLVDAKKGVGRYLTERGQKLAERLFGECN